MTRNIGMLDQVARIARTCQAGCAIASSLLVALVGTICDDIACSVGLGDEIMKPDNRPTSE